MGNCRELPQVQQVVYFSSFGKSLLGRKCGELPGRARAIPPAWSSPEWEEQRHTLWWQIEMLAAACFWVLRHSWLTKLFFKARNSHSELLRADLTTEPPCSVPFLSWAVHKEIYPYTNEQQNWVQRQLPFPFHISPLKDMWLCQPSPYPCPSSTNTHIYSHEEQCLLNSLPSLLHYSLSWTVRFGTGTLGSTLHMTRHIYSTVETTREEQQLPKRRSKYSSENH